MYLYNCITFCNPTKKKKKIDSIFFFFFIGTPFKYLKHRIDALDADNCMCNYTLIEGDVLGDKLESISYEVKFESAGGGRVCKITSHYQRKGDFNVKEEDIKEAKDKHMEALAAPS